MKFVPLFFKNSVLGGSSTIPEITTLNFVRNKIQCVRFYICHFFPITQTVFLKGFIIIPIHLYFAKKEMCWEMLMVAHQGGEAA